ncbi:MAG: DNA methyltransferase [Candidatus Kariarchaeaceae archaeon]|jgi:DNA modification methylase
MKSVVKFSNIKETDLPKKFQNDDNRYTERFVEFFLDSYTKMNDLVLDPFAGYGTSLLVCERLNRIGYGIEYNQEKVNYIKTLIENTDNIVHGDVRTIDTMDLPQIDFLITSPPYMNKFEMTNPFDNYETKSNYHQYLKNIYSIFKRIQTKLKNKAVLVIEVANLKTINQGNISVTTLAWDLTKELSKIFHFEGEKIAVWEGKSKDGTYGFGYDHSYSLIFSNS